MINENGKCRVHLMIKNYITPIGYERLKDEALHLINQTRPEIVRTVQWAASNGDRSENGDYIYGKKKLREIDKRIRFLTERLNKAVVVDPIKREPTKQIFFGATVTLRDCSECEKTYTIVGVDETNPNKGYISWKAPLAKALIKLFEGDAVTFKKNQSTRKYIITNVSYDALKAK